jgi:transcriptional regulator PpsR
VDTAVTANKAAPDEPVVFQSMREWIGGVSSVAAARAVGAAGDIVLILDPDGLIRDVAISHRDMAADGLAGIRGRRWADVVAPDSRFKVDEMLAAAREEALRFSGAGLAGDGAAASHKAGSGRLPAAKADNGAKGRKVKSEPGGSTSPAAPSASGAGENGLPVAPRWREVNHVLATGAIAPVRVCVMAAGGNGWAVAVGRDLRAAAAMQQKLLQVEQAMERDYARLRHAENRYRILLHAVSDAVLVVDAGSRRIVEANPAAGLLLDADPAGLIGKPISWFLAMDSQETAAALLMPGTQSARSEPTLITLAEGRGLARMSVSIFRQDRVTHLLVRLQAATENGAAREASSLLLPAMERSPDAIVVADEALEILDCNAAFLDLAQLADASAAVGAPLSRFIGRSSVDTVVLMQMLREHGWARNFSTVVRTPFETIEGVDVSAAAARHGGRTIYGFTLRPVVRVSGDPRRDLDALPRSVEQLTELIGRIPLKEIVRETTDIIERLCVEAALKLTGDNRASAAELLGLSRQSLYSKLHRFDLAGNGPDE